MCKKFCKGFRSQPSHYILLAICSQYRIAVLHLNKKKHDKIFIYLSSMHTKTVLDYKWSLLNDFLAQKAAMNCPSYKTGWEMQCCLEIVKVGLIWCISKLSKLSPYVLLQVTSLSVLATYYALNGLSSIWEYLISPIKMADTVNTFLLTEISCASSYCLGVDETIYPTNTTDVSTHL